MKPIKEATLKELRWLEAEVAAEKDRADKAEANLDYIAMMADVEIPVEDEGRGMYEPKI